MLAPAAETDDRVVLSSRIPFIAMHVLALSIFLVGFSWAAVGAFLFTYWIRVFALTAGYHRYFSHRSFRTSRWFQFVLAFVGATSAQMGALWWASHHRVHHRKSDQREDVHSPVHRGFWWSHLGWIFAPKHAQILWHEIRDFEKYPELKWLDLNYGIPPILLAGTLFLVGALLPDSFQTSGWQFLAWGFFFSTVCVYHVTFMVNSVAHLVGTRRFETEDQSRNNWWVAFLTGGEGWHNNHHRFPHSERQGFYWWEFDLTHYALTALSWVGLVWDLKRPSVDVLNEGRKVKRAA